MGVALSKKEEQGEGVAKKKGLHQILLLIENEDKQRNMFSLSICVQFMCLSVCSLCMYVCVPVYINTHPQNSNNYNHKLLAY